MQTLGEGLAGLFGDLAMVVMIAGGLVAFALFLRFEREGKPQRAVGAVLLVLLLEVLLYYSQNAVRPGLFAVNVGGVSLRLPELVILAGLAARLIVRGLPPRYSVEGVLWTVFFLWWTGAFVVGVLYGNAFNLALFQFKAVVYLGGGIVLAGGVPVRHYVARARTGRWMVVIGVVLLACVGPTMAEEPLVEGLPMVPGTSLGVIGGDGASLTVCIGLVALMVECARRDRRRLRVVCVSLLLFLFPFFQHQRAALMGLGVSVALLLAASWTGVWRRQMRVNHLEAGLFLAVACVPLLVNVVWAAADTSRSPDEPAWVLPFAEDLNKSFTSTGKQQSAQTRQNLWRDGARRIGEHPVLGSGLGTEYSVDQAAVDEQLVGGGFHNLGIDILVRSGLVGLVLFLVAAAGTVTMGLRVWRRHPDTRVAALALGALLALANLVAKGMVESVFEKYRLAAFAGLLLGVLFSAGRSLREEQPVDEEEVAEVALAGVAPVALPAAPSPHGGGPSRKVIAS